MTEHGTVERWRSGCSCSLCRRAINTHRRLARLAKGLADGDPRHGTRNGWSNWGCECAPCSKANVDYWRDRRAQRKENRNAS